MNLCLLVIAGGRIKITKCVLLGGFGFHASINAELMFLAHPTKDRCTYSEVQ